MQQFDVIVLGGGPGGYLCAERAQEKGFRTALIEERALGGTCLNEGCIPTKSLLYCAKQYDHALHSADCGVTAENVRFDQRVAVERKDRVVTTLVRGVGATMKAKGVTVFSARGTILGKEGEIISVQAGDEVLQAKRLVIATGSEASVPPITGVKEGLASGFVMTNREILALKELPKSLCCIGGGVIGLEMACYFAAVGVKVTVVEMLPKIAGATDPEICDILMKTYKKQGMTFLLSTSVKAITETGVEVEANGEKQVISCDKVLLSAGRRAVTRGFGLETLGVATERPGIVVDEHLQTNVPGVYAIGDCNGKLMLAHTAYREAEVAVNHMAGIKDRIDYSIIPSVIYTTPEVASVGETEQSAKDKGLQVKVVKAPMRMSGRYLAENPRGDGFCKLIYDTKNKRLVGAHMVGAYCSEMIYGAAMMVQSKLPLEHLNKIVFPHPTVAEVVREALFMI